MAQNLMNTENEENVDPVAVAVDEPTSLKQLEHAGMIAVVGRTNAGKSTLVNRIIGEKISIVSPVVQTTRNVVRGVLTDERGQLVLIDTPGLHKSKSPLCTIMNKHARAASEGVDAVLLVMDGSKDPQLEDDGWMRRLLFSKAPCVFALNKSDEGNRLEKFQELWSELKVEKPDAIAVDPIWLVASAKTGDGVDKLEEALFALLPPGPMLFDEETLSDYPKKLSVADVIREKFFLTLRDELPHSVGVKVDEIIEAPNGGIDVRATVYVQKYNHKGIVIGPKGRGLRAVRRMAEKDLEIIFEKPVSVEMWIKVEKDWDQNYFLLKQMGYV